MEQTTKSIVTPFEPDMRKHKDKWQSKKQFNLMKEVRERFNRLSEHRASSCPYALPAEEMAESRTVEGSSTERSAEAGTDWSLHWNRAIRQYMMYRKYDEGKSNVRSPISFAPIEAIKAEAMDSGTGVIMGAVDNLEQINIDIIAAAINHEESIHNFDEINIDSKVSAAIYGSSIEYISYLDQKRSVELFLGEEQREVKIGEIEGMEGEEKEETTEKIKTKPLTEKKEITVYQGLAKIPVSIYDFFPGDSGSEMHKPSDSIYDCVWRKTMSLSEAYDEFKNSKDPYIIKDNVDKIVTVTDALSSYLDDGSEQSFLKMTDGLQGDMVEVLRYYNKLTDKYIIIVNDIVLREGPLPFNHKELPFVIHRYKKLPGTFWGIGLPTLVESQQSEIETFKNMQIEQGRIAQSPVILVNTAIFEDIDSQYTEVTPGMKIEVGGSVGNENIRVLETPGPRYDVTTLSQGIKEDSIEITGINPLQFSMPTDQPVRNNLMIMESGQKMIRSFFKLWSFGERDAYRQYVSLLQQFVPETYELIDESGQQTRKYPTIKVPGKKFEETHEGLMSERINGESTLELKPEYMQISGQIDFKIDVDSMVALSKSVRLQALDKAFAQLIPILANPQLLENPMIAILVKDYVKQYDLPKSLEDMIQDQDSTEELEQAEAENQMMLAGEDVAGTPGRSNIHVFTHTILLTQALTDMMDIGEDNMPTLNEQQMNETVAFIQRMQKHLEQDTTPKDIYPKKTMADANALLMPPAPQQAPMPPEMAPQEGMMPNMAGDQQSMMDAGNLPVMQ